MIAVVIAVVGIIALAMAVTPFQTPSGVSPSSGIFYNAGAPTSGGAGTFATKAAPGALLIDTTNSNMYQNTNTQLSPTWTLIRKITQQAAIASLGATANLVGVDGAGSNAAPLAGTETRLDNVEAKVDAILVALRAAGVIAP